MITNYFKELKQAQDLDLVDYIINRSKLNCNYIRLIELIEKACKKEEDESYSSRRIEINFYPVIRSLIQSFAIQVNLIIFSLTFFQQHLK